VTEVYKLKAQGSKLKAKNGIIPYLYFQLSAKIVTDHSLWLIQTAGEPD
jgi:hypothetical protein